MITFDIIDDTQIDSGSVFVTGHGIPGGTASGTAPSSLNVLCREGRFVPAAVNVSSANCANNTATIVTAVASGAAVGDTVFLSNIDVADYNGVFKVTAADPSQNSFSFSLPGNPAPGSGGVIYLPELISAWPVETAVGASGQVTLALKWAADIPLGSPVFLSGLTGAGAGWNGVWSVSNNPASDPLLAENEIAIEIPNASGTAGVPAGTCAQIVSLMPVSLLALPRNPVTNNPTISLDAGIEGYSAQLVAMVTPAGEQPTPLGIVHGTTNLENLDNAPFAIGQQAGNSVVDIVEFYYAGAGKGATFDVSQVDGFALPLSLEASAVSSGPRQIGVDTSLPNFSREAIGKAFNDFIANEPEDVRNTGQFGRLLYDSSVFASSCAIAPDNQTGAPLTGVSFGASSPNSASILATASGAHGLVPGQSITVTGAGAPFDGTFAVQETGLTDPSLTAETFTYNATSGTSRLSAGTVTPVVSGVIAASTATLVVRTLSKTSFDGSGTALLSGVSQGNFPSGLDGTYTVQAIPGKAGLSGVNAVYLATSRGQSFAVGSTTGGGTISAPVFAAPPKVPRGQFFVIAAPKDWLANQDSSTAEQDPLASWWDDTVDYFFAEGNYLQVNVGTDSYTGRYNPSIYAYEFYKGLATKGTVAFRIDKPGPVNGASSSLARAEWVWAQAGIPANAEGTVWDQIVQAFCRGVALDGVLKSVPTSAGQSNTAWTKTENWYTEHVSAGFPDFTSRYCPFSKFLHYGTLDGGTDRSGATSIYLQNLAYGFSEDETPLGTGGSAIGTPVPSKMDGTVADGTTLTLTVGRFPDKVRAQGIATWEDGVVIGVQVTNPGSGYVSVPDVTISPSQTGMQATAVATIAGGKVTGVTVTNSGSRYDEIPLVTFSSPVS